jgi:hypothetical protein
VTLGRHVLMSYRRQSEAGPGSSRWRTENRATLAQWLPEEAIASDRSLTYVLLHGDDEHQTDWSPAWLQPEEAAEFLAFLRAHLPNAIGYELMPALERRSRGGGS